ncbi:aminotransferase class V-fold PLP-dependent enzyme [Rubrobacter marinus]|uniref:cysteine desulfurase n=1 Tax=Rubrobacter marinus TaxID=2653852 RepID=A0A6G8Q201_9ACTN|nr:cysteine desulfurase family protein [Rubrobacter marinus]QIN80496.1 aminotransferase class V-fold PLP-dependent enzyme [Rubrobacter marinus]
MPIYLDYNATTPLDERVLDAMLPYLKGEFGNPSSATHAYGWTAGAAVDLAREELAGAVGASPEEITFTAGATESDNMALLGLLRPGDHLVTAATEHEAILETVHHLVRAGVRVTVLPVDGHGMVHPDALAEALEPGTRLVSLMLANNETGTLNGVRELAEVAHERGVPFHTDAAQAFCKVPVDVEELGVDLMSISAHKCYGPKGVGALYARRRPRPGVRHARPEPILFGGGQERGMRSGTLNVPGIVGLGRAASVGAASLPEEAERIRALRDRLHGALAESVPDLRLNGHPEHRLPGTLNVSFPGVDVGELLGALPDVAASAGSACASLDAGPSHVLEAMGLKDGSWGTVRLSLGRFTTGEDVERASEMLVGAAVDLRSGAEGAGLRGSGPR